MTPSSIAPIEHRRSGPEKSVRGTQIKPAPRLVQSGNMGDLAVNPASFPAACVAPETDAQPGSWRLADRVEAYISRLSTKNNFWHRVCSFIWLPLAFKSGIRMKRLDANTFAAILPFRRVNRNWYNAMAGAALLANSEIAGGMYVFGVAGGDYTVVCKHLEYKFLRPCLGPAVYRISPREDIQAHLASRSEFNITLDLDIVQQLKKPGSRDRRVGRCAATFHVTPKVHHKRKRARTRGATGD
ncbi:MAG: hypothetical protein H7Y88_09140 [Phycisphaerales bacterium]|nr:hypothetical protein [Phycisphaerales bacterium]